MKINYSQYIDYYENEEVIKDTILLEGGQGKNINGNIFHFLKEICTNKEWSYLKIYYVVTDETMNQAKNRFDFYQYHNIKLVIRQSDEYLKLLASCQYLITDNSFPPYFIKKTNQIYLNTWHGTPLKILGRQDIKNSSSFANVQKNYMMADYALFPNKYTRDIFMDDYSLRNIGTQKIILADYPRNTAFFNDELKKEIIQKYQLDGKEVFAYMPTWRGSSRNANVKKQKEIISTYLQEIDQYLSDNQVLYVNLHFLIGNDIDMSDYQHIKLFPSEYETYDFLNVCDTLITDYSSVFFDFAVTGKRIILFTYDLEEYIAERGMYFPIDQLPFPRVRNVEDLIKELNSSSINEYSHFQQEFCAYAHKNTTYNLMTLLTQNKSNEVILEDYPYNGKQNELICINSIKTANQKALLLDFFKNCDDQKNYFLCFNGKLTKLVIDLIENLPSHIQLYGFVSKMGLSKSEKIKAALSIRYSFFDSLFQYANQRSFERESLRRFYHIRVDRIIEFYNNSPYLTRELSYLNCEKINYHIDPIYTGLNFQTKKMRNNETYKKDHFQHNVEYTKIVIEDGYEPMRYNLFYRFIRIWGRIKKCNNGIQYSMIFAYQGMDQLNFEDLKIQIGDYVAEGNFSFKKGFSLGFMKLNKVKFFIDNDSLVLLPIQNKIKISSFDFKKPFQIKISYNVISRFLRKTYHSSKIIKFSDRLCCYFRQSKKNDLFLTVRPFNRTDLFKENLKINLAYYISKLYAKKNVIILFEKNSARYEESASIVYEKLIDKGYRNAYFILDKNYDGKKDIQEKYKGNIIDKYSFRHYLYFFKSQTFLGSEALVHALELRNMNKHVLKKLNSTTNNYVFLQHGVMYMISLDSESRTFFKPRSVNQLGKYRVVVSSDLEAKHFIELGGYDESQVIVCGLPKFDKSYMDQSADKIVIMPTWRPWEYNEASVDFKETKYYQMILRIFDAIPQKYDDKIVILPHPLFVEAAINSDFKLKKYMVFDCKYDTILRDTKVLITDYSSIAYDAFYRGCRVIFYWEELDYCLEQYGRNTKLMLNEENVYGDVCYCKEDLIKCFENNYNNPQDSIYKDRYQKIVEFHDNQNTERLIQSLKNEKII
ncbi:CDP-glycerol glycerophosphotransferase family protein [Massilimicrobiota sp. SW1139]|uniref:CDP-glycerol glycerophosphotransferase family protein n=1 Tax=Massilimicrobiota sp. SW1139 TaxID=2530043 RepID=UPI00143BBB0A|nr:CDP-glycerol glycerophosphotransferase family protein [Massilimicrobiota sp. SW1139]NJE44972.1 hypothetical protein [Massilimicrobiota sp. SW1139]